MMARAVPLLLLLLFSCTCMSVMGQEGKKIFLDETGHLGEETDAGTLTEKTEPSMTDLSNTVKSLQARLDSIEELLKGKGLYSCFICSLMVYSTYG